MNTEFHNGGFRGFLQKLRLIIQPLILASSAVILWHFLNEWGLHSTSGSADEPVVNAIYPFFCGAHLFLVNFLIFREGMDWSRTKAVVKRGQNNPDDENLLREFLELAEDRIPTPILYVLLSTGTLIQIWTTALYYQSYWIGFACVFSVSYVVILLWEVIQDLDDPVHGIWVIKGIPKKWARAGNFKRRFSEKIFDSIFGEVHQSG